MLDKIMLIVARAVESMSVNGIPGLAVFFITLFTGIALGWGLRSGIVIEKKDE